MNHRPYQGGFMEKDEKKEDVDALCPECGHGFKVFVDRILANGNEDSRHIEKPCPVCGCGNCEIGKK